MGNLGAADMEVSFKGEVEPISMPLLAKAFGWPEFSGTLAASIPGVRLKNNVLTFDGNVESQVFGGRITGSNIRLQDPLGNFPQFFADVRLGATLWAASLVPIYAIMVALSFALEPTEGHPLVERLVENHSLGMMAAAMFTAVVAAPLRARLVRSR